MPRIAYVNGRYVPHDLALIHVEDRAHQFADGVYEVCGVWAGRMLDRIGHLDRLERSLRELRIAPPVKRQALEFILQEMVRRNRIQDGLVYIQVSRGAAPRDHAFPPPDVPSSLILTAKAMDLSKNDGLAEMGVSVITVPETRWARVDIKSVSLLPNVLAKQKARDAGAYEAWFVDDAGYVTEGASTNAWIVTPQRHLVTRELGGILAGITRHSLIEIARSMGLTVEERPFTVSEALGAHEAFISSATSFVMPVVELDGKAIANGRPGSVAGDLRRLYKAKAIEIA